jgi:protoporphyrinogen IX oxidase
MQYGSLEYSIIKSLHLIFMVSYFAGLFYIVRLMIYHTEADAKSTIEKQILFSQFIVMEKKLWNIIVVPAFVIMVFTGFIMLISNNNFFFLQTWMHFKLSFILVLFIYHFRVWMILKQINKNQFFYSSLKLRMLNEVATIILFSVIFSVVMKDYFAENWYWLIICFVLTGILIMGIVKLFHVNNDKRNR